MVSTSYLYVAILAAVVVTLATAWIATRLARRLRLLDVPGSAPHKLHTLPTPLAGGVALVLSLAVLLPASGLWREVEIARLLLPAGIIFVFSLVDDARGLSAPVKLLGQLLAVGALIASGIYIQIFESPQFFLGGSGPQYVWLDWAVTVLWIVGVTNAFNLVDSMDGLAVGLSGWAFAFFMLEMFDTRQVALSTFCALLAGICLVLYAYNVAPARLFLGDSGAQTLGFLLAAVAILYTPHVAYQTSSWFVPILLVAVPIFDTTLVVVSRLRRKERFYIGHRDHTYHRLVARGMGPGQAVFAMHLAALILGCVAFIAVTLPPLWANGLFVLCLLAGAAAVLFLDHPNHWRGG